MISHRNLTYALKLSEIGNYRRAADALNITHSALVRSIKALESYLEIRLFNRGRGTQFTPTKLGEVFLEHARKIIQTESDLVNEIMALQKLEKGVLNIGMGAFPSELSVPAAVGKLICQHPDLRVQLNTIQYQDIYDAIVNRQLDLGIVEVSEVLNNEDLFNEPLCQHRVFYFCRPQHPLALQKLVSMDDLVKFPWCSTRMPSRARDHFPIDLQKGGRHDPVTGEVVPAITVDTLGNYKEIVLHSDALCLAPLLMFREEIISGELSILPFHKPFMVTNFGFVYLKNRSLSPSANVFMDILKKVEGDIFVEEEVFFKAIDKNSF